MSTINGGKLDVLFGRRSVRVYSPGEVSEAQVTRLLEAAMAAPSAMTKDPWRFVVMREAQTLAGLGSILPGGKMLPAASLAIVACGDLEAAFEQHISYLLQDCSAAIENLLIAAHAEGLGACWVGVHPLEEATNKIKTLLALPGSFVPVAVIAIGQPGEQLEPRTRYDSTKVRFEKWQAR